MRRLIVLQKHLTPLVVNDSGHFPSKIGEQNSKFVKNSISKFSTNAKTMTTPSMNKASVESGAIKNNSNSRLKRSHYKHFLPIQTRWMDNDVYGYLEFNLYLNFCFCFVLFFTKIFILLFFCIFLFYHTNTTNRHVNNVTYYSYFDTVVNSYLISHGGLDIEKSNQIGIVVETQCQFKQSIAFPDSLEAGLVVAHLGTTSVRYEIGIFKSEKEKKNDDDAVAFGHFVHVFVDRETRKPKEIGEKLRKSLQSISIQH